LRSPKLLRILSKGATLNTQQQNFLKQKKELGRHSKLFAKFLIVNKILLQKRLTAARQKTLNKAEGSNFDLLNEQKIKKRKKTLRIQNKNFKMFLKISKRLFLKSKSVLSISQ